MKMKALVPFKCFKSKLRNPSKRLAQCFKFRLRKPVFIRGLHFRFSKREIEKKPIHNKRSVAKLLSALLSSLKQSKDADNVTELKNFPEPVHPKAPLPSPITPAYVKMSGGGKKDVSDQEDVEDACRSFEDSLIDMIVEDGKVRDVMDVEELLHCWKNLKSPVFIDLVCRFYGELCKDLFSSSSEDISDGLKSEHYRKIE